MKKKLVLCIAVLLLLSFFVPIKKSISQTFSCTILDQQDESFRGDTQVTFSGVYYDYLLRKDCFQGRIECPDYRLMDEDAAHTEVNTGMLDEIMNYSPNGSWLDFEYTATIYAEENLDRFFIWVYVPVEDHPGASHGRYFLCYPDMDLQDVYAILDSEY